MNDAKKLGKYLSKLGRYEVFIGLDHGGRIGCLPLQRVHLDGKSKRVILIVPLPAPEISPQPKSPLIVPASSIPKMEMSTK